MTDERNFRSSYYEKVGCRGVEEKKSLEILMKEKPWDKVKLKQFCLRFTVPAAYRNLVWKVLLDLSACILPLRLGYQCSADTFIPIVNTLLELYDDEVDVYWLAKSLTDVVRNMQRELPKLKEAFITMLEKEDGDVFNHLVDISALEVLPLTKWFNCCFAGVLDDTSLTKIWDKVCSGAPKILSFAAVMLVITLRRNILRSKHSDEVLKCVSQIPEQCEEVVANKAIELWQYYGAQPQNDTLAKK
ncbi:hypothetical protein HF086_002764 [Spodoptera exigua]|uniref:TBC1 domain family member 7 n=1 Tax=Spodoptera exigua TaxID=7107 RepID=A0A922SCJ3_SPOEX|nr:hypothetical protein HF086_002764 [Spodoptera exigua]